MGRDSERGTRERVKTIKISKNCRKVIKKGYNGKITRRHILKSVAESGEGKLW